MNAKQTRRKFLGIISKITGATIGMLVFGRYFTLSGRSLTGINSGLKQKPFDSGNKILVAYASKSGSTVEIAKFIGNTFSKKKTVEVLKISEVTDLSRYSQVIIGSPIIYDKWIKEARHFIKDNEGVLAEKKVSFFLVCLVLCGNNEKTQKKADKYASEIEKTTPKINVRNFGQFKGVLNYSKMSFKSKIMMKPLMASKGLKEGDYRDWKQIEEWTKRLSS